MEMHPDFGSNPDAKSVIGTLRAYLYPHNQRQKQVMITLFSLFADIERELISMRTKEALAAAHAVGVTLGRPKGSLGKSKLDDKQQEITKLLSLRVSKASIANITDVSRSTLVHFIRSRGLQPLN